MQLIFCEGAIDNEYMNKQYSGNVKCLEGNETGLCERKCVQVEVV